MPSAEAEEAVHDRLRAAEPCDYSPAFTAARRSATGSRQPASGKKSGKKPYNSPRLVEFGDLRSRTLGPSVGVGESGNPTVFRVT